MRNIMAFLVLLRTTTTAFPTAAKRGLSTLPTTSTRLRASFFDDLVKGFSSMAEGNQNKKNSPFYTVGITGASGLIGRALQDELSRNHPTLNGKPVRVVQFTRGDAVDTLPDGDGSSSSSSFQLQWNPKATNPEQVINPQVLQQMDALIHLSGENISTGLKGPLAPLGIRPWTPEKKQEILDSRVLTTQALCQAIMASGNKQLDFLVASGVGAYGPNFIGPGDIPAADESTDITNSEGFLAEVSRQWEGATIEAQKHGNRVVIMRNGVVLSRKDGAMAKLYPIFFLGGGGIVGSGHQYFPYISCRDMARAIVHLLETRQVKGPVNMCAPSGCTNAEFTAAMGKVMGRPTLLPFPSFAVSLLFGEMGEEILLGGTRAEPKKLLESGFSFNHPTVEAAVQSAVGETI